MVRFFRHLLDDNIRIHCYSYAPYAGLQDFMNDCITHAIRKVLLYREAQLSLSIDEIIHVHGVHFQIASKFHQQLFTILKIAKHCAQN